MQFKIYIGIVFLVECCINLELFEISADIQVIYHILTFYTFLQLLSKDPCIHTYQNKL